MKVEKSQIHEDIQLSRKISEMKQVVRIFKIPQA